MKLVLGMLLLLAACAPASAQSQNVSDYVQDCSAATDTSACKMMSQDIDKDLAGAWKADYQSVRNVSYCLMTGCDGAVRIDVTEGCAWRAIAYTLAPTGKEKISETKMMDAYCKTVPSTDIVAYVQAITPKLQ